MNPGKAKRLAVIGVGSFGKNHVRVVRENPHADLRFVVDSDLARAREFARELAGEGVDSVYVEVRGYHPLANGHEDFRRTEVDSRWQNELEPTIDAARKMNSALKGICVTFDFNDVRLPKSRTHKVVAEALITAVEAAAPRILTDRLIKVSFLDRATIATLSAQVGNPPYVGNWTFLASEDFPVAAEHFNVIRLEAYPQWEWPPWSCPRTMGGWNSPCADEFREILEAKQGKAKKYNTHGRPLWLLIVSDLISDMESHVFPKDGEELASLRERIAATGFDFAKGPFQQVWLFSRFSKCSVRLDQSCAADSHAARC